jgi:hypothetical protein
LKRLVPLILFAAVLALFGGCGSSASTSSGSAAETSLTRAEFIARADALCAASKAKQEPLREKVEAVARRARAEEKSSGDVSDSTRTELAATLRQIGAIGEDSLAKIDGIPRPEGDADQLKAIFRKVESAFEGSTGYAIALEGHQDAEAQAIAEKASAETRESDRMARRYGFKVCGSKP